MLNEKKKIYYNNLILNIFEGNKTFWKRIKPLFSEKSKMLPKKIVIIDNEKLISAKKKVAEKLNIFFIESVENLDIEPLNNNEDNLVFLMI